MEKTDWVMIEAVLGVAPRVLLHGPPGTGKTHAGCNIGEPSVVYNVTATDDTPAAEFRGHFVPEGGKFIWMDGPVIRAMREGARLVINEIDRASNDLLTFLYAVLDDPGMARITLPTGEEVRPAKGFSVVATMNGDPMGLPPALRDRFAVCIEVTEPHPDAIKRLPKRLRPLAENATGILDEDRRVSVRAASEFHTLSRALKDEGMAARAVFGRRAQAVLNSLKVAS